MQPLFQTVIQPRRTVTLGGEQAGREMFRVELQKQSLADVRSCIRFIAIEQTAQQIALGNPPQVLTVDGRTNKSLDDVGKQVVIVYGVALAASAMREVELELAGAIARSTRVHSGRLSNLSTSWQWMFVPKGGTAHAISAANPPAAFGAGDQLVLLPKDVPYATITNRAVALAGKLNPKGKAGRRVAKSRQNRGFLATATAAVRAKSAFKQFSVATVFSKNHMVAGELMTRTSGTAMIVIRPRIRRVKV